MRSTEPIRREPSFSNIGWLTFKNIGSLTFSNIGWLHFQILTDLHFQILADWHFKILADLHFTSGAGEIHHDRLWWIIYHQQKFWCKSCSGSGDDFGMHLVVLRNISYKWLQCFVFLCQMQIFSLVTQIPNLSLCNASDKKLFSVPTLSLTLKMHLVVFFSAGLHKGAINMSFCAICLVPGCIQILALWPILLKSNNICSNICARKYFGAMQCVISDF